MQLDPELTLAKAIQIVRQNDTVKKQQAVLHGSELKETHSLNIDVIRDKASSNKTAQYRRQNNPGRYQDNKNTQKSTKKDCGRCGTGRKHSWKECPVKNAECRKCKKLGHFAVVCRTYKVDSVSQQDRESSELQEYAFLGEMSTKTATEWTETVTVNGTPVNFKLDTGAAVSAIPESIFKSAKFGELKHPQKYCMVQDTTYWM